MNEMLNDSLAFDRYKSDTTHGEANYHRQASSSAQHTGSRAWIALALVNLATRLQPNLTIEIQQPSRPATA